MAAGMSPYLVTTREMAERFCTSVERIAIFRGFLQLRQMLRSLGFQAAWQWVDGSFCEDCEKLNSRPPNDIDIITLYRRPPGTPDPRAAFKLLVAANLHDRAATKVTFQCDAFWVDVDHPAWQQSKQLTYWFGLLTHQRVTNLWKGLLAVELGPNDDDAQNYLNGIILQP